MTTRINESFFYACWREKGAYREILAVDKITERVLKSITKKVGNKTEPTGE
jgi:hypothetical protein